MEYFYDIRKSFFNFFKEKGHVIVPSSSLVPDDPSVLLTTAGMQQFKRYYTGELNAHSDFGSQRVVSIQKCFRTSDVDEVGDNTHLTFFEMMGNFSFGPVGNDEPTKEGNDGYFKRSAIVWGYEYLTNVLHIDPQRMYVTIFKGDDQIPKDEESYAIWYKEIGIPKERIFEGTKEDNFWGPTGSEGPCGPTTEIYVAPSADQAIKGEGVEVWNIVFNEYYKERGGKLEMEGGNEENKEEGTYRKVENPGIDTGMGFERLLATLEGVEDVFETSAFQSITATIDQIAPAISLRDKKVLADHIRGSIFLSATDIEPSNKERGYILRRLLRRVIGLSIKNDIHSGIFESVYQTIKKQYGDTYPEIQDEKRVLGAWNKEFSKFQEVIANGVKEIAKYKILTGKEAFSLYETFGLPFELIYELAPREAIKNLHRNDFEEEFKKHQEISRAGLEKKFGGHGLLLDTGELKAQNEEELRNVLALHTTTHLLQWALRKTLGDSVHQMGSDITAQRLRFDFSFERKLTPEELQKVETLINEQIKKDLPVYFREMSKEEALKEEALAFFKEKYPDRVKVYYIGSQESGGVISKELCGGPHVSSTSQIGKIHITKEESTGKGIRRIRAIIDMEK